MVRGRLTLSVHFFTFSVVRLDGVLKVFSYALGAVFLIFVVLETGLKTSGCSTENQILS